VRFEYQPPNPTLVVCDGSSIYVLNRKLNTRDRYPLAGTPLELILGGDVDLKNDQDILGVRHEGNSLIVEARSSKKRKKANIRLVFTDVGTELRQWTVIDDQGLSTTVALRDIHPVSNLPDTLFEAPQAPQASEAPEAEAKTVK
jgi:outer membrane lipoprotein-sorting protein